MKIKPVFIHKNKEKKPHKYLFAIPIVEDDEIYFYTFSDLSGFKTKWSMQPDEFIIMGMSIIAYKDFIRDEVKKHLHD